MTSNSGQLQSLYVQSSMDYSWNGLDNPPKRTDFYISVRFPDAPSSAGNIEQIGTEGETISSSEFESQNTKTHNFSSQLSILSNHSGISDADFEKTGDDWTKDTNVEVNVRSELTDDVDNTYSDTNTATFTVLLTDEPGSVNGGGRANPGGSAN